MKANRKFVEGEEAVSAVIGVILMVAITVAIAATVYVYVSGMLTTGATKAPDITFQKGSNYLQVVSVSQNVSWSILQIGGEHTAVTHNYVIPGQKIEGCSGTVTVTYDNSTLLGSWDF